MSSKQKIFLGTRNVASQLQDWQRGFESLGHSVLSVAPDTRSNTVENGVDINLSEKFNWTFRGVRPKSLQRYLANSKLGYRHKLLTRSLKEYDVFVFIWNSIFENYADLPILKAQGKKIVFLFVGNDVRAHAAMKQDFELHGVRPLEFGDNYDYGMQALEGRVRRLRMAEKYADLIVSTANQGQLALRPYHQGFAIVDPEIIPHRPEQREKPLVIHAPSNSTVKGSQYIMPVLEKLRDEALIELKYVRNMAYTDALKLYAEADILVGQALCPTAGKQEREALAAGSVVLSSMYYNYPDNNPKECPIIDINPDTLEGELRQIIPAYEKRKELALKGRDYVMKYHQPSVCAQRVLDLLDDPGNPQFHPTFYREQFIPESQEALAIYNKWNDFVKSCSWYSQLIEPGERAGLKF